MPASASAPNPGCHFNRDISLSDNDTKIALYGFVNKFCTEHDGGPGGGPGGGVGFGPGGGEVDLERYTVGTRPP